MSARIFVHPRMPMAELQGFLQRHERTVLISGGRIESFAKLGPELTEADTPPSDFECLRCDWSGDEPAWFDTGDFFSPPRGEMPQCPACGDFNLSLRLKEAAHVEKV